jgi:hypothetical protein
MIIAIHQPNFLPWLGYFYKISKVDVFVLYDDVQFTKNGFTNRNKIKTPNGELWLTLPVKQSGKFGQNINKTEIINSEKSQKKIIRTLEMNYKKCPFYDLYIDDLTSIFEKGISNISELNIELIKYICGVLCIKTKLILSSSLKDSELSSEDRLIEICKNLGGNTYLSGKGGANYQNPKKFEEAGIELVYTEFVFPNYEQPWGDFLGNLSIIDILFNIGADSIKI